MNTEQRLIIRLQRGDRRAFKEFLSEQKEMISSVIFHKLWDQQLAKDCAQNIMFRVVRRIGDFQGQCRLSTWVYRIAVNECIEMNRTLCRSRRFRNWDYDQNPFADVNSPDGLSELEQAEIDDCIHEAVEGMSKSLRVAFQKYYLEQLCGKEAAEALDISEAALFMRLKSAREKIRKHLQNRGIMS